MAILESEDLDVPSSLSLTVLGWERIGEADWRHYELSAVSGTRGWILADAAVQEGVCALSPPDCLRFLEGLCRFVARERDLFRFTPDEPNFDLELLRDQHGVVVTCWVDSGNQFYHHHTWDAVGVRFLTTEQSVGDFYRTLEPQLRR